MYVLEIWNLPLERLYNGVSIAHMTISLLEKTKITNFNPGALYTAQDESFYILLLLH